MVLSPIVESNQLNILLRDLNQNHSKAIDPSQRELLTQMLSAQVKSFKSELFGAI